MELLTLKLRLYASMLRLNHTGKELDDKDIVILSALKEQETEMVKDSLDIKRRKVKERRISRNVYFRGNVFWLRYAGPDGKMVAESTRSNSIDCAIKLLEQRRHEMDVGEFVRGQLPKKLIGTMFSSYINVIREMLSEIGIPYSYIKENLTFRQTIHLRKTLSIIIRERRRK
jgi:hypothetical protein